MFVQVIRGQVSDPKHIHAAMERWMRELAPGASGWLGSTGGVTDDGRFVAFARFESADSARRNSARPEQDAWWSDVSKAFTGDVTFIDSEDVVPDVTGDPDRARFVQVLSGRATNPRRARQIMDQSSAQSRDFRPEILGSLNVMQDDGSFTMAIYFTSEQEAREGERKEPPPELAAQMEELNSLAAGPLEFLDLKDPWLYSPR
jgi:hypothetical protein